MTIIISILVIAGILYLIRDKDWRNTSLPINTRRLLLLEETAMFYNTGNRSLDDYGNECRYRGRNGTSCAIGRIVDEKTLRELHYGYEGKGVGCIFNTGVFPPHVKSLGKDFLDNIQQLHDKGYNWHSTGLSFTGVNKYEEIKHKITTKFYN